MVNKKQTKIIRTKQTQKMAIWQKYYDCTARQSLIAKKR